MKQFLQKSILFIISTLLITVILFFVSNSIVKKKGSFKIDDNLTNVILGHSHSECAFNDSFIDRSANYSSSGESYFYTLVKIKKLIVHNPNINTVFIEFSNNSITDRMNDWIWGDLYMSERLPIYFPFIPQNEIKLLYKNNKRTFLNAISKTFRKNVFKVITSQYDYSNSIGGYQSLEGSEMDQLLLDYKKDSLDFNTINYANENLKYLRKTVDFLKINGLNVYFTRSPHHKYYIDYKNEKYFIKLKDSVFGDIEYLDFSNFPIENIEHKDFGHLNNLGAEKFSIWFNNLLKEGLLNKPNKQDFIKEKMNEVKN